MNGPAPLVSEDVAVLLAGLEVGSLSELHSLVEAGRTIAFAFESETELAFVRAAVRRRIQLCVEARRDPTFALELLTRLEELG